MNHLDQLANYLAEFNLPAWSIALGITLASLLLMLALKGIVISRLRRVTQRTPWFFDTLLLKALSAPITIVLVGFHLLILERLFEHFDISSPTFTTVTGDSARVFLIVALIVFFDRISRGTLEHYASSSSLLYNSQGIARGLLRGLVFGLGLLVLLGTLGVSVTPIIASLGITSLAVALALQPTLENFFSGVQLLVDKPFQVGDFIELDSGEQGYVQKIGWRSTWIKMLQNNTVILPNSQISQSRIVNYDYPVKELSVLVEVGVHYSSDLEQVEVITKEVASEVLQRVEGAEPSFTPRVMFHSFADSSINFTVVLRAREYVDNFAVKSAFIKALHKRYGEEGITIPYPIRAINTEQEGAVFTLMQPPETASAAKV